VAALEKQGKPSHIFLAALIASPEGIRNIQQTMTTAFSLWTAAVDEQLNHNFYIVPGLGDAGDLSFGNKL
jgi:uracil phosphoribosyltransferase